MELAEVEKRRAEFFDNVWNHSVDVFQTQFDQRRGLGDDECIFLKQLVSVISSSTTDDLLGDNIRLLVDKSPERLALLLQLVGLTRNKIITDLKAVAMSTKSVESFPGKFEALCSSSKGWSLAGPYLAMRVRKVFGGLTIDNVIAASESLNQATWSGWIRQERAKRSGHEGEARVALVLYNCLIPFVPIEKVDNPLCKDIQINDVSFDIVIPNAENPLVCLKATVHTSNIGQFGESKDHLEIDEARRMIDSNYSEKDKPLLCALIDGIGFNSNRAGLDGVLSKTDVFCKYQTLWKVFVISAFRLGIEALIELPDIEKEKHKDFLKKYNFYERVFSQIVIKDGEKRVVAGNATIIIKP